ncbi:uncharacterized protein LOC142645589 isoform X2 [Dermatophagoides pteronyssinus]|uniref:uncharacterized protein LOC142645589 isoform X2 n=1 Tax=Dermatophagoides pteronyssinus TaxID=6956 RepID=UPI003F66E91E
MKQTVENQELTSKQSESQEELSTDNAGAYPKKDSDDQYYDELFSAQKKIGEELAKLTKQHDEKYEIKKQNATTQQEIDALELERIDTRPEIIFDDDVLPILIENPKTSELKKQWLKKQKEREEEREWARIKEEYEKALKKWLKQYDKQEKRYNETRSDEDYRILKQLELNKPRLYDDEGNEIIDMTTPLQRQEQPISQQQQRSRQQQQRQTILQEQQRSRQHQQQQKLAQQQQSSRQHQQQQKLAQQQQSSRQHQQQQTISQEQQRSRQHQQQQTISQEQQRSRQHQRQQKLAQQEKVENQQISKISSNDSSHESKASALSNIKQSTSEQQTVENQELTSKQSESQEELSTDNAGAYPKKIPMINTMMNYLVHKKNNGRTCKIN